VPLSSTEIVIGSWLSLALAVGGLLLSLRMFWQTTGGRSLPGCGSGSGCNAVTRSRWSRWCGIPVALPAAILYLIATVTFTLRIASAARSWEHAATTLAFSIACLLAATAVWFVALQWLVIRRLCPYCMILHFIGVTLAFLVLAGPTLTGRNSVLEGLSFGDLLIRLLPAIIGILALVLGQVLVEPQMYALTDATDIPEQNLDAGVAIAPPTAVADPNHGAPVERASAAPSNPFASAKITALDGRVAMTGGKWPMLGSPSAAQTLICLFDYTCENCRHLHGLLYEILTGTGDTFSVMLVPVPTDPKCNPTISGRDPLHANACAYARLALSLWLADWSQYAAFDEFMFVAKQPPTLGQARKRASELVGREFFDPEVADPDIDPLIRAGIDLYESVQSKRTPTLLMAHGFIAGHVATTQQLLGILEKQLAIGRINGTSSPARK
jgi:uncharacterized membrane protein